jgi:hypothetical protein
MNNLKQQISESVQHVLDEKIDALEVYAHLKSLETYLKKALETVKPYAMSEADKYEKSFEKYGFKFEKRNGHVTYDYTANDDYKEMFERLKSVETILANASKMGKAIVDEETGEIYQPCPVKSGVSDSLIVKLSR